MATRLKRTGAMDKDIATAIGVRPETFCRWVNNPKSDMQRQLGQELKKCEANYKSALLSKIAKAADRGQWQAAAWILERKYPEEFSRRTRESIDRRQDDVPRVIDDV